MSSTDFTLNILATLNKQLSKRQLQGDLKSLDNSMFIKVIAKLATTLSRKQLKKDMEKLNDLYVQIGANVSVDKNTKTQLQNRIKELQKSLSELEVNLKVSKSKVVGEVESVRKDIQAKAKKVPIEFDIEVKRSKAIADIEYLGKRFSKLFTNVAAKQKYDNILASAYSITDENQLKSVRNQISAFTSELKANGLASQSLGDKWRSLLERSKNLLSAASIVTTIFTQVKQAVSTFLQLDTAMTNLYKVTNDISSRDQFSGLLTKWNKLAQNLAVTTQSLINATAEWSKIGFDLDMSEQLAQITAIFEKTAEISTEKASSTLISAAQAFTEIGNLGEDDYVARVEAIGDRINAIGNKYSISSEGISDALQNASAALKVAGNDLDETIALVTAANKIFQSPSEVSNMLKVASMRLRGQVDALEEMGEDATGVSTDITKIQQQIYELTGNKVNIFEDEDTLKSTYQMILEIGEVFDSLNDRSQAGLLEVMFGKQRSSAGASLLLNYKELEKIKNDSMNAANSMAEEYGKYMESAEAHITIFKEKLVETYSTFMSGDMIKYTADVGSGILDLVNSTDLLKHSILAVLALNISKGVTAVGAAIASTSKQMNTLGSALQQIKNLPLDNVLRERELEKTGELTKLLTEKNLNLLLSQKQLSIQDKINILSVHGLTEEEAKAKLEKMGLTTATNAQSAANITEAASTNVLRGAMTSLKASIIAVGTSIKAEFMSNPLTFILTGITTVISVATTAISRFKQKQEAAAQALQDAVSEYESAKSSLANINSELEEQNKKMDELLSKDKLTYAEQGQLEELQEITRELQLQQDIEERRAAKASKEVASKAVDAYQKQYGKYDKTEDYLKVKLSYDPSFIILEDKNNVLGNVAAYIRAQKLLEQMQNEYEEAIASGEDFNLLDQNLQYCIDLMNDYSQAIDDNLSDLQDKRLALEDEYNKAIAKRESGLEPLASLDKEVIETYESISDLMKMIYEYTDSNTWKSMQIENVFNTKGIEKTKEELIEMVKAGEFDENTLQSYPKLSEALKQNKVSASELRNELEALADAEGNVKGDTFNIENPILSFEDAWANSFTSENDAVKKLGDSLLNLAEKGRLTIDTFNATDSTDYFKNLGISAEEAVVKINKLVDESNQLSSMSNQLFKISDALGTKRDDGFVSVDTLSGFDAEIHGLDSWDRFQEVLGNVNSSYEECQAAASALATEWVNNSNFLSQLTEQNKEYYATQLRAMGIENYEEILNYAYQLNAAKEALTQASFDLSTATREEIQSLIDEGTYTELAQQQIWALILAKQTAEGLTLDTSSDCQNLLNLAQNAGVTGDAITLLTRLMNIYNNIANGVYGNNYHAIEAAKKEAENIKSQIDNILSKNTKSSILLSPRLNLSPKTKSAAKSAGKETGKAYLDGLKEELSKMNSIISYVSKILGKKITSYGKQKDDAIKALEAQKDAIKEAYEAEKNAASAAADAQKDAIQDQIDAKQAEIDKINEAAKARKNELDLQKAQYELERMQSQKTKLVYSEDKGMHYVQDTSGIRNAKEKVTEAKENKVIAGIEKEIDALNRQLEAIEEQASATSDYYDTLIEESDSYYDQLIENTENYWDALIDGLEEYQTRWEELADIEEQAKMNAALKELGITTEEILNMSEEDFENFKKKYLAILTEIYAGDEEVLIALQEASGISVESLQPLIEALRESASATDDYSDSAETAKNVSVDLSTELDNTSKSADNATKSIYDLNTGLDNVPTTDGYDAISDALGKIKGVADAVCESVKKATTELTIFQNTQNALEAGVNIGSDVAKKIIVGNAHASGTKQSGLPHAEKNALVSEYGQREMTVFPNGKTVITDTPTAMDLPKGSVVYNEEETKKILNNKPDVSGKAYAKGIGDGNWWIGSDGHRYRDLQPGDKGYDMMKAFEPMVDKILKGEMDIVSNAVFEGQKQMERWTKEITNNTAISNIVNNNKNIQQPIVNHISVTLPNVTNSTSAEALMRDLQSLNTKKYQVNWNK